MVAGQTVRAEQVRDLHAHSWGTAYGVACGDHCADGGCAAFTGTSRELPAPVVELDKSEVVLAEPIIIIREEDPVTEAVAPSRTVSAQPAKKPATQKRKTSPKRPQAKPDTKPEPAGTVPYDKVYSLIQTGQRALKNNTSVIKIQ